MIAFLPHPRHFFDADADDADALFGALPARGCRARAIGARAALAPSGSMQLAREGDCYIISAALPGARPEEISCIEVVGNRTVRLEVKKTRPRAAPAAPAPAAHVEAPAAHTAPEAPASGGDAEEPVVVEDPASAAGGGDAAEATTDRAAAEEPPEAVVLDQQLTLPQPVDTAGITCTYRDGLLRIQVPIVAPALGDDHRELMAALEQEANDAAAQVAELAQQLKEQKAKALEAQQALHAAKIGMHRAAQTRRHTLSIAAN
jgi:HSP20 family molecular chaperone IbpA